MVDFSWHCLFNPPYVPPTSFSAHFTGSKLGPCTKWLVAGSLIITKGRSHTHYPHIVQYCKDEILDPPHWVVQTQDCGAEAVQSRAFFTGTRVGDELFGSATTHTFWIKLKIVTKIVKKVIEFYSNVGHIPIFLPLSAIYKDFEANKNISLYFMLLLLESKAEPDQKVLAP